MEFHHVTSRATRLPILPYAQPVKTIKRTPGSVDFAICISDKEFLVRGWMLHPQVRLNSIQAYLDGDHIGAGRPVFRQDLADHLSWVGHAAGAGFEFRLNPGILSKTGIHHLDLIGYRPPSQIEKVLLAARRIVGKAKHSFGIPVGRYHTLVRSDTDAVAPSPPAHLMDRVVGGHDPMDFKTGGIKLYSDFLEALARHRDPTSIHRILDWGCGCGRSTVHLLLHHPNNFEVHGCDIDGEAIAWCRENLPGGHFAQSPQMPPLPYPDGHFDAIVSCSVFSHLKRDMQHFWLAELKRVLAPGGLLLASFHGTFAAAVAYAPEKAALVDQLGIVDDSPDDALGSIVEKGYYNSTFQTRGYTMREWSKHLKMVDYVVAGMHNYQDLAVMQKCA